MVHPVVEKTIVTPFVYFSPRPGPTPIAVLAGTGMQYFIVGVAAKDPSAGSVAVSNTMKKPDDAPVVIWAAHKTLPADGHVRLASTVPVVVAHTP